MSSRTKPFKAHTLGEAVSLQYIHGDFPNHLSTNTTYNLKVWPLEIILRSPNSSLSTLSDTGQCKNLSEMYLPHL